MTFKTTPTYQFPKGYPSKNKCKRRTELIFFLSSLNFPCKPKEPLFPVQLIFMLVNTKTNTLLLNKTNNAMININAFNFDSPKKMKFDHCSAIKIVDILEKSINSKLPED